MDIHKTIVNFCPTGMVPNKAMTPFVPISVSEIVEQVQEAYEIGITIAHLHAREQDGCPSWKPEIYRDIIEGVRSYCPDLVICHSTSGRNFPEFEKRSAVIELQPDMCSLTLSSLNFARNGVLNSPDTIQALAEKMLRFGVKPELECFDLGMINYGQYLMRKGLIDGPCYWNLLFGNVAGMQLEPIHVQAALTSIPQEDGHYVALGGLGDHSIRAARMAIDLNLGLRVGLEDNIWKDGSRTELVTNKELVEQVNAMIQESGGRTMSAKEFGESGFYNLKSRSIEVE